MRKALVFFMLATVIFLWITSPVLAEIRISDKVTMDANIRYRMEILDRDFDMGGAYDVSTLRSNLGFRVQASEKVLIRVKFIESRFLGTSGTGSQSSSYINFKESYIQVSNTFSLPLRVKVGRFEFAYGRNRILGPSGWGVFGPRTYDGGQFHFAGSSMWMDVFFVKIVERSHGNAFLYSFDGNSFSTGDRQLFGAVGSLLNGRIQPLIIADWDEQEVTVGDKTEANLIVTPAVYAHHETDRVSLKLDAGVQFGTRNTRDLFGYLFAVDAAYTFSNSLKPRIGAGVDITSGNAWDKDGAEDTDNVFYAPYMTRHGYRGFMDYFQDVRRGMLDAILRLGIQPVGKVRLTLDIHNFQYMENDYSALTNETYTALGQELDFRAIVKLTKGLSLDTAVCTFLPTEEFAASRGSLNTDMGLFYYFALTGTF